MTSNVEPSSSLNMRSLILSPVHPIGLLRAIHASVLNYLFHADLLYMKFTGNTIKNWLAIFTITQHVTQGNDVLFFETGGTRVAVCHAERHAYGEDSVSLAIDSGKHLWAGDCRSAHIHSVAETACGYISEKKGNYILNSRLRLSRGN
jgi:hypothetical protein